jgi:hypothetical protein
MIEHTMSYYEIYFGDMHRKKFDVILNLFSLKNRPSGYKKLFI